MPDFIGPPDKFVETLHFFAPLCQSIIRPRSYIGLAIVVDCDHYGFFYALLDRNMIL